MGEIVTTVNTLLPQTVETINFHNNGNRENWRAGKRLSASKIVEQIPPIRLMLSRLREEPMSSSRIIRTREKLF